MQKASSFETPFGSTPWVPETLVQWWMLAIVYLLVTLVLGMGLYLAIVIHNTLGWLLALAGMVANARVGVQVAVGIYHALVAPCDDVIASWPTNNQYDDSVDGEDAVMEDAQLDVQAAIGQLVTDHPPWVARLEEMLAWERAHPPRDVYDGWQWQDVHTHAAIINQLIAAGLVNLVYSSHTQMAYRLRNHAETEEALQMIRDIHQGRSAAIPPDKPVNVDSLFRFVFGQEDAKMVVRRALQSREPVHVVLVGPPGSAKTEMLSDIAGLPGAEFYAASTMTRSGLVGLLVAKQPKYLVLDEIDKPIAASDLNPLLSLMQNGYITILQHNVQKRWDLPTRVFAACNEVAKLQPALVSRFAKLEFPSYTPQEFVQIGYAVLTQKDGIDPKIAQVVVTTLVARTLDIRDARRVAQLVREHPMDIDKIVERLFPTRRTDRLQIARKDGN